MEKDLYYLCSEIILILEGLKKCNEITDEELKSHLKIKKSFLQVYQEMDIAL